MTSSRGLDVALALAPADAKVDVASAGSRAAARRPGAMRSVRDRYVPPGNPWLRSAGYDPASATSASRGATHTAAETFAQPLGDPGVETTPARRPADAV